MKRSHALDRIFHFFSLKRKKSIMNTFFEWLSGFVYAVCYSHLTPHHTQVSSVPWIWTSLVLWYVVLVLRAGHIFANEYVTDFEQLTLTCCVVFTVTNRILKMTQLQCVSRIWASLTWLQFVIRRHKLIFSTAPAASKNDTRLKSGQDRLKNSHLVSLI